jgi:hypothetical protein
MIAIEFRLLVYALHNRRTKILRFSSGDNRRHSSLVLVSDRETLFRAGIHLGRVDFHTIGGLIIELQLIILICDTRCRKQNAGAASA